MSVVWKPLVTVSSFFDCPRVGVAMFGGRPHLYEAEFSDELDDYTGVYLLMPISDESLELAREQWGL